MVEIIEGWQCPGCGKIEVPASCMGMCADVRVALVSAENYAAAIQRAERAERECRELRSLLGELAGAVPVDGLPEEDRVEVSRRAWAYLAETEAA